MSEIGSAAVATLGSDVVAWAAFAPLLALVGSLINAFFGKKLKEPLPGIIGSVAIGLGFILTLIAFIALLGRDQSSVSVPLWHYLVAGDFHLDLGFTIDSLSIWMMLIVTGVSTLIHIYSIGYMHGDEGNSRYFAEMNLFVASMLVLVMANSFVMMFMGWEGVGVCSYLLIAFWYQDKVNADAGRKAFIVTRIGDIGFLLAMFLAFATFGTLNIAAVNQAASTMVLGSAALTGIGLLFLLGAVGKSAQLPLQVWLPDAMAGPTPVSALIHAATMVTAGVYLIARLGPLYMQAPGAAGAVAWVGALTAFIAAFAAFSQKDFKRILAYSTISQIGYMFAAVGVGAYWAGVFHIFTHAFFKALLFMAAGSVMHALGGEKNIDKMGGLGKYMKVTGITALIATCAISGVPFFSGFFSKDAILTSAFNSQLVSSGVVIWLILLITEAMTTFYMFRWYFRVFTGEERFSGEVKHVHESPRVMTMPLVILAFFSIFAGYIGLPAVLGGNWLSSWLTRATGIAAFGEPGAGIEWLLIFLAILMVAVGFAAAYWMYKLKGGVPARRASERLGPVNQLSQNGAGFDALYQELFIHSGEGAASGLAELDQGVVDRGLVTMSEGGTGLIAKAASLWQSGYVRIYALAMLFGLMVLLLVVVLGMGA
jgi:NADH-quinone oxidoreductase subunit L